MCATCLHTDCSTQSKFLFLKISWKYRYKIKNLTEESCVEAFPLEIFKHMYAKTKYAAFDNKTSGE